MKLEPLFKVENHKLYKISDNSAVDLTNLKVFEIKWSDIEIQDEVYNEELLANLREELKQLDELNQFAIISAIADKPLTNELQLESFTNAFNHTARRIKDCISVTGIALPAELTALGENAVTVFIDTLSVKHAQYVYYTKDNNIQNSAVVIQ